MKAAVLKTVKPQGFVGSNPTASARNAARPEPAGSGRFSLFGPAFRLELPAHERMFHVKHSGGGRFARMEPASAVHDRAAHAQQNRRFGRLSPSPSIKGNTRPGVLPAGTAPSVLKLGRVPNRGVSGPSPENRRHPCEVNLSLRPPSGQWRSL